jgi:hypothetical protein
MLVEGLEPGLNALLPTSGRLPNQRRSVQRGCVYCGGDGSGWRLTLVAMAQSALAIGTVITQSAEAEASTPRAKAREKDGMHVMHDFD